MQGYVFRRAMLAGLLSSVAAHATAVHAMEDQPASATTAGQAEPEATGQTAAESAQSEEAAVAPGEIVVTARRRSETLSRVGMSVAVVGGDQLTKLGIANPSDLAGRIPGFQATRTNLGSPFYSLRGVGFTARSPSSTSPVGIYLDQAAIPFPYMAADISFDLDRIEVLKGPQGTLYGRNATGGLVNYVTAKPTDRFSAGFNLEVGNYRTINVSGFVSGPLSDWARVRIAGSSRHRFEGWQYSVTRDETLGESGHDALRAILELGDGGPFNATITGSAWWQDSDSQAPQAISYLYAGRPAARPEAAASIISNPTNARQADWHSFSNQPAADRGVIHPPLLAKGHFYSVSADLGYELGNGLSLRSLTTYQRLKSRDVSDTEGLQTQGLLAAFGAKIRSVSQELRLVGEGDKLNWSIGGYYADDNTSETYLGFSDQNGQIETLRAIALSIPQTRYTADEIRGSFRNFLVESSGGNDVLAAFANAEYKFSDLFKLSAGARYTRDRQRVDTCPRDPDGNMVPLINTVYPLFTGRTYNLQPGGCYLLRADFTDFTFYSQKQKDTNLAWNVTATLTPSDSHLLYATVARGFKSGVFPTFAASVETQLAPVDQEQLTSYEVGTKLALFDRRVRFNLNAFYYDYRDKQIYGRVADLIFGSLLRIRNIPKSRVLGVEGDASITVASGLNLTIAGTYLDSKILSDFQDFNDLGVPANFKGRPFTYTPKFSGSISADFTRDIGPGTALNASTTVTYQDKSFGDFAGLKTFEINGRTLVDATLGLEFDSGWRVGLYGKNIFNKYYWTGTALAIDTVARFAGMPREYGIRLGYKF